MTKLEPITNARARELFSLLRLASREPDQVLILDESGRVERLSPKDQTLDMPHVLGDLDVHA